MFLSKFTINAECERPSVWMKFNMSMACSNHRGRCFSRCSIVPFIESWIIWSQQSNKVRFRWSTSQIVTTHFCRKAPHMVYHYKRSIGFRSQLFFASFFSISRIPVL